MANIPKKHHLIPRVYLRNWCHKGENVHTYNKKENTYEDKNINSILYKKDFNSIKVGSLFTSDKALIYIFEELNGYKVYYKENLLDNRKMNENFLYFDNWKIIDKNNNEVIGKRKRKLKNSIISKKNIDIEEEFSKYLEINWEDFRRDLEKRIENCKNCLAFDYKLFMKYFYMFDLRGTYGNEVENSLLDKLLSLIHTKETIPESKRIFQYDDTLEKEIKHANSLKRFSELLNDEGTAKKILDLYIKSLSPVFYVDKKERFYTSDKPVFSSRICRRKIYNFVVSPSLFVEFYSNGKFKKTAYDIKTVDNDDVTIINDKILRHGELIISKYEFNKYKKM